MPLQLCTHVFDPATEHAHDCGSPALRGELFCYFHHPRRAPSAPVQRRARQTFDFALPTTPQHRRAVLNEILQRLASNRIDAHRAGLLLYGLQLAEKL